MCVCVLPKGDHIVCVYVCSGFTVYFGDCFMLVHKYLCNLVLRESFPRQVDKEPRGPQGERGLEFSRRKNKKKKDNILPEDSLWIKNLANSVILKCKLWE